MALPYAVLQRLSSAICGGVSVRIDRGAPLFPDGPAQTITRSDSLRSLKSAPPSLYMQTQTLLAGWSRPYGDAGMSVRRTDPHDSDKSVSDTVALMGAHASAASMSPQVKQACKDAGVLQQGITEEEAVRRVFRYVKGKVQFVEDNEQLENIFSNPESKELLITPPVLLSMEQPKGDCDDFSMLTCSMLMAMGVQCDFVTVAANSSSPKEFSHIYNMARLRDGRNIPLDTSHGARIGWETQKQSRRKVWPVFNWGGAGRGGLGMVVGKGIYKKAWESQFGWRKGLAGLGDFWDDIGAGIDSQINYPISSVNVPVNIPQTNSGINWNQLLPGIFGTVEKIAVQTTQQPGYQTTGPQGSVSYVLAPGQTASGIVNIPGVSTLAGGNNLLLIGGGLLAAFLLVKAMGR